MESLLNFCETFQILEEVVKHRLEKEVPTVWQVYRFFFFYSCLLCTKRVLGACKAQAGQRIPGSSLGDFQSFGKATTYIV